MKAPAFRHMALACLVSFYAWTPLGRGKSKGYLTAQKNATLNSDNMREAFARPVSYHNVKNWLPTFLEEAPAEEMSSKYLAFCGVSSGFALGSFITALLAIAIRIAA